MRAEPSTRWEAGGGQCQPPVIIGVIGVHVSTSLSAVPPSHEQHVSVVNGNRTMVTERRRAGSSHLSVFKDEINRELAQREYPSRIENRWFRREQ